MRKIILILSIVFISMAYVFPSFILPFGQYKGETEIFGEKVEYVLKFELNGKVKGKIDNGEWEKSYYDIKGNTIYISDDLVFNEEDLEISISNIYTINVPLMGTFSNNVGLILIVIILVLDLILIITIPRKKK